MFRPSLGLRDADAYYISIASCPPSCDWDIALIYFGFTRNCMPEYSCLFNSLPHALDSSEHREPTRHICRCSTEPNTTTHDVIQSRSSIAAAASRDESDNSAAAQQHSSDNVTLCASPKTKSHLHLSFCSRNFLGISSFHNHFLSSATDRDKATPDTRPPCQHLQGRLRPSAEAGQES